MANPTGKGGFKPGNRAGPGRPRRTTERQYLDATIGKVPLKAWREVVARALEQATNGDAKAREWLGKILIGETPAVVKLVEELRQELERLRDANATRDGAATDAGMPGPPGQ
jgi:hypothetical protein